MLVWYAVILRLITFYIQIEDDLMQRVMKETQERLRMFEEGQRKWQEQQQSPQQMVSMYFGLLVQFCSKTLLHRQ